jgi:superfamily II DNA or RNA helicase
MTINESKTKRQKVVLNNWKANGYIGTFIGATGFGKTYLTIMGIRGMRKQGLVKDVIVTVPTINLQQQWMEELNKHGELNNTIVLVNNTAAKKYKMLQADLVIHDEVHTVPAEIMGQCLLIKRKYTLCLTATIERRDGAEKSVLDRFPIIDTVDMQECLDNGWISPFKVYNIPIPLSEEDTLLYKKADNSFKYFAIKIGYGSMNTAQKWLKEGTSAQKGIAGSYMNCIRKRKKICVANANKFDAIKELIEFFPDRYGLVFGESTDFADKVTSMLPDECLTFHSKMGKKAKALAMKQYKDKRTKVRIISSVKALDAGFDFPDVSLGIVAAGNSSLINGKQRVGRIVRAVEGKNAVIINLFSPNTQEVKWLEKRTEGMDCEWLSSIEEFKQLYKVVTDYEIC